MRFLGKRLNAMINSQGNIDEYTSAYVLNLVLFVKIVLSFEISLSNPSLFCYQPPILLFTFFVTNVSSPFILPLSLKFHKITPHAKSSIFSVNLMQGPK